LEDGEMRMIGTTTGTVLPRHTTWRGRSGRSYGLMPLSLAAFTLEPGELYLVAKGGNALWVGSAEDIIADQQSRRRFRLALVTADRAFRLDSGTDDVERMTTIWDLEEAAPEQGLSAA
jgi:hypothetical protein